MSPLKKYLKFTIPSIISMWIFSLYTIVDGIFVARGVGSEALAGVNLAAPFTSFIFATGLTIATGTATVVAHLLGQGKKKEANCYFNQNLAVAASIALIITTVALFNLNSLITFLGGGDTTFQHAKDYVKVIACFAPFFILSYNLEVMVKVEGAPHVSALAVFCCALMNVALDYLFVICFAMGVTGAAVATGLAQVTSTTILIIYILVSGKQLRLGTFSCHFGIYKRIIPVGLADGLTELSNGIVIFLFNRTILNIIGESGIVSYTVVSYVNTLMLMTMSGIAQGIQPLVSFHRGEGHLKLVHKFLRYALITAVFASVPFFLFIQWNAGGIAGLFFKRENIDLLNNTVRSLRLFSPSFLFLGFNVILAGFFAAIERPSFSLSISLSRGLLFLSASLFLLTYRYGETGIWISTAVSELCCLLLTMTLALSYRKSQKSKNNLTNITRFDCLS